MEELVNAVQRLGWSQYEAACYAALVRHGRMKASQVAMHAEIHSSKIYQPLNALEAKGYVRVVDTDPNVYRAQNPQAVIKQETEQFRELSQEVGVALQEAWEIQAEEDERDDDVAWITQGQPGAHMELRDLINSAEDELVGIAGRLGQVPRTILRELEDRCTDGLAVRLVSGSQARDQLVRLKRAGAEVRERASVMRSAYYLVDGGVALLNVGAGQTTVVIRDADTVKVIRDEFDRVYEDASEVEDDA